MKGLVYSPAAAKEYRAEVDSINAKLESVIANKPKERRAMVIANANIKAKIQALDLDPKLDKKEIKKISSVEMQRARDSIGASGSKTRITFTDREWEAVQKGAISDSTLLGFLRYNFNPAKVFMGDTGSLFLGGAVAGLAFACEMPLILLLVGLIYIIETLSVILQVTYFKATHGKRLFKMAPIHHHFEMCGWGEKKIVLVFTGITVVLCLLAYHVALAPLF